MKKIIVLSSILIFSSCSQRGGVMEKTVSIRNVLKIIAKKLGKAK
jgi:hypothetical protein